MFKRIIPAAAGAACVLLLAQGAAPGAASNRKPEATVRFHLEASEEDTAKFAMPVDLVHSGRRVFISRMPAISEMDVVAFYPFEAGDDSWGASFYLDNHGRLTLDSLSIERRGEYVVAVVNGRQVTELVVDRRVNDGIITVPSGLTAQDIELFDQEFKRAGAAPVSE